LRASDCCADCASDILGRHGRSPVRHLASLGLLDARLVAAHCVWVDSEEIALLAASGAGVVVEASDFVKAI
jgi:5-methylthioadenosine/S-adenosylhomocysteine deaminase